MNVVKLSKHAQKIQNLLTSISADFVVLELPQSTRTAADAAVALDCTIMQIIKSLVFKTLENEQPILVLASGNNRVDTKKIEQLCGHKITKADAEFVKSKTGFSIGGIPPIGHAQAIETYIDEDLMHYEKLWAAAGMPNAVFSITPSQLKQLVDARIASVKALA